MKGVNRHTFFESSLEGSGTRFLKAKVEVCSLSCKFTYIWQFTIKIFYLHFYLLNHPHNFVGGHHTCFFSNFSTKKMPTKFCEDLIRPVLMAYFRVGRLYSKIVTPDKAKQLEHLKQSLDSYKVRSNTILCLLVHPTVVCGHVNCEAWPPLFLDLTLNLQSTYTVCSAVTA
jgi:hypothetical protein